MEDQLIQHEHYQQSIKQINATHNKIKHSLSITITDDSWSENLSLPGQLSDPNFQSFINSEQTISEQSIKQESKLINNLYQKVQNYKFLKIIGKGSFGTVHRAIFLPLMKDVAVKIIDFQKFEDSIKPEIIQNFQKEIAMLKQIMQKSSWSYFYEFYAGFQYNQCGYIVMELLEGFSLEQLVNSDIYFSNEQQKYYIASLVIILEELHNNVNCIHRDIKPENIVIQPNVTCYFIQGKLILIDFGCAKKLSKGQRTCSIVGTCEYYSPNRFKCDYSYESDFWSLGVLAYELALKKLPFQFLGMENCREEQKFRRLSNIIKKKKPMKFEELKGHNVELQDLIQNIFNGIANTNTKLPQLIKMIKQSKYFKKFNWSSILSDDPKPPEVFSGEKLKEIKKKNLYESVSFQQQFEMG